MPKGRTKKAYRHTSTFHRRKVKILEALKNRKEIPKENPQHEHGSEPSTSYIEQECTNVISDGPFTDDSSTFSKDIEIPFSVNSPCCSEQNKSDDDALWSDSDLDDLFDLNCKKEEISSNLRNSLRNWVLKNSIPHSHVNELLEILTNTGIQGLPKDSRTLMSTPKSVEIKQLGSGEFWYNGIENCLKNIELQNDVTELKLNFHFDGLPLGKSTKQQFWPILLSISNVPEVSDKPFVVAIYCGNGKPDCAEIFLEQFVNELNILLKTGIKNIQSKKLSLRTNAFICDTPARAFIKCTVSHNAYRSCIKCTVQGCYDKGGRHISFQQTDCTRRTDSSFRNKEDPGHHQKNKINNEIISSPLEKLPVDMVNDFIVADSLHLIDFGVMKRCLTGWVHGSYNFKEKFFSPQINSISSWLEQVNKFMPSDIHRSVRGLDCLSFWKGTEFRTFLLYLGPVILKQHLSGETYRHFMLFFCAVTIFSAKFYVLQEEYLEVAGQMMNDYIEFYISLYGADSIGSNVHNLCHIVDDVRRFGYLSDISTYKFENELGIIKHMLRSGNRPLAQVAKRIIEKSFLKKSCQTENTIEFKMACQSPDDKSSNERHFKTLILFNVVFQANEKNQWFLTKNNQIVKMVSAYGSQEDPKILGCSIKMAENFFIYPLQSKQLNIFKSLKTFNNIQSFSALEIKCKMFKLEYDNILYFFPLVHTLDIFNKQNIK